MKNALNRFSNNSVLPTEHNTTQVTSTDLHTISLGGDDGAVTTLTFNYVPTYLAFEDLEKLAIEVRNEIGFSEKVEQWAAAKSEKEKNRIIESMIEDTLHFYHPNIDMTFNHNSALLNQKFSYQPWDNHWSHSHEAIVVFEAKNKIDFSYKNQAKERLAFLLFYKLAHVLLHVVNFDLNLPKDGQVLVIHEMSPHSTIVNREAEVFAINVLLPFSSLKTAILHILEENIDSALDIQEFLHRLSLPIYEELIVYQIENHKEKIREIIEKFIFSDSATSDAIHENEQIMIEI